MTITLIEYPIAEEDRASLIDYGTAAVAARKRLASSGVYPTQTSEGIDLKNFCEALRKRLGVQWTRPAFLPRMEFTKEQVE